MIMSTNYNPTEQQVTKGKMAAQELGISFVPRENSSIIQLLNRYQEDDALIFTKHGLKLYSLGVSEPLFFHPGMAKVRIKRLLQGDNDRMIEACDLRHGDRFLDATLGLASDAIVASYAVGENGEVTGLEAAKWISYIVSTGLKSYRDRQSFPTLLEAMQRIQVIHTDSKDFLKNCDDNRYDVIYFDPMFREAVKESDAISPLRRLAKTTSLSKEMIKQACRVARKRVVLKERRHSGEFERLGFKIIYPSSSSFTYGVINV